LPYAAALAGNGLDRVYQRLRDGWRMPDVTLVVLLPGPQSVDVFVDLLGDRGRCVPGVRQGGRRPVRAVRPAGAEHHEPIGRPGVPHNWQEPIVSYMADRKGWSLAAELREGGL
jgi:hypothetical protein